VLLLLWGIIRGSYPRHKIASNRLWWYTTAVRRCRSRRQLPRSQGMLTSVTPVGHKRLSSSYRSEDGTARGPRLVWQSSDIRLDWYYSTVRLMPVYRQPLWTHMLEIILLTTTGVGSMTLYIMEISTRVLFLFIRDGLMLHKLDLYFWNALHVCIFAIFMLYEVVLYWSCQIRITMALTWHRTWCI
jgi:hypothetical protein